MPHYISEYTCITFALIPPCRAITFWRQHKLWYRLLLVGCCY